MIGIIQSWLAEDWGVSIVHTLREANRVANWLAGVGHTQEIGMLMFSKTLLLGVAGF